MGLIPCPSYQCAQLVDFLVHGVGIDYDGATHQLVPERDIAKADLQASVCGCGCVGVYECVGICVCACGWVCCTVPFCLSSENQSPSDHPSPPCMLACPPCLVKPSLQIAFMRQEIGIGLYLTCTQVVRVMDCFLVSLGARGAGSSPLSSLNTLHTTQNHKTWPRSRLETN